MIHITHDNFIWLDVTEQIKQGQKKRDELWLIHELFAIDQQNDSERLIESIDDMDEALRLGLRVCIEGGRLPQKYQHKKNKK